MAMYWSSPMVMTIPKLVKWPAKYATLYRTVKKAKAQILNGKILAIDPASKTAGYALYDKGKLVTSGKLICKPKEPIAVRLASLHEQIQDLLDEDVSVVAIEQIRGTMAHAYLKFAVGAAMAASGRPLTFEVPINVWRAVAKATVGYEKSDDRDAELIGEALIRICSEDDK